MTIHLVSKSFLLYTFKISSYIKICYDYFIFSVKAVFMPFPGGKLVFRNGKVIEKLEIVFYWDSLCC